MTIVDHDEPLQTIFGAIWTILNHFELILIMLDNKNNIFIYSSKGISTNPIYVINHRYELSHDEIFGAGPYVGLFLLKGCLVQFLEVNLIE